MFSAFGSKLVTDVSAGDLRAVLQVLANDGFSKQQCIHVRNDVSTVVGELWRDALLPENVAKKVRIPKNAKVDRRERAVLTDEDLVRYLAWEHPIDKKQQPMACVSRMFGGLRTGDILALRWDGFDTRDGASLAGWAPRKKTARPQALEVPEVLRPTLRDWWERQGRPAAGLIFPVRGGATAGTERKPTSFAHALRRDLRRALGVDEPRMLPVIRLFPDGERRADTRITWLENASAMTDREREPFTETAWRSPAPPIRARTGAT